MEKVATRKMQTFVLSSLLNLGIGLAFGLLVGIVATIATEGDFPKLTMLIVPGIVAAVIAVLAQNMYRLYFYYRLSLDVDTVCKGDGLKTGSYLTAVVLSTLTFGVYQVYWVYKLAQRLRANAPRYQFKMLETGGDIAVLEVLSFGYVSAWELIKNMNRIAGVYNRNGLPDEQTDYIYDAGVTGGAQ